MSRQKNEIITNSSGLTAFLHTSTEFLCTAEFLICQLQNKNLRSFLTNRFGIKEKLNVFSTLPPLTIFEKSRCNRLGAVYTPASLVNYIVTNIEIKKDQKYLDPGIGTGNIILSLIDKILALCPSISLQEIIDSIYGFDIDVEAIELCKIRVLLKLEQFFNVDQITYFNLNLIASDFTIKLPTITDYLYQFNLLYQDSEYALQIKQEIKFDYIIGNPPFVTFYGRRSKKLLEKYREYYLRNYDFIPDDVKNGKLNLYMFFIEHGINKLKENGRLIYILDNSIYETPAYHLRKWIIKNFQLISIDIGLTDFTDVASGQTIWQISNSNQSKSVIVKDVLQNSLKEIDQKLWLNNPECKIHFSDPSTIFDSILNKLNSFKILSDYFPGKSIRTCCMLLDLTEKFLVTKDIYEHDKSGLVMPYLEGSKSLSDPDAPLKFNNYIKYDYELQIELSNQIRIKLEEEGIKNKKRIGLGQLKIYQSPKIFLRQSANKLIAKFTKEIFMANNSIYVITPIYSDFKEEDWEKVLIYTERLLCSKLYLYFAYLMKVIRKNTKQQPQIKVSDLKQLPFIIDQESDFFQKIVNLNPINRTIIDSIIYDEFKFTCQELNEIECLSQS